MAIYQWLKERRALLAPANNTPHALLRTLVSGLVAAVSGLFLSRLLGTVAGILVVRQLGVTLTGEYATLTSSLGLLASFLGLGLDTWLLRNVGQHPDDLAQNVWSVVLLKLCGTIALLVVLVVAWSSNTVRTPAFLIGVTGVIFDGFAATCYSALRATRQNGQVAFFQTLSPLLLVLVLLGTMFSQLSVLLLVSVQAVCSVVVTAILCVRLWRTYGAFSNYSINLSYVLRGAWLFIAADVLANLYSQSGAAILGWTVGADAVGIYRPALSLVSFGYLIPNLMFSVALPLLSAPTTTPRAYSNLLKAMLVGGVAYGVAVFVALHLFGESLIHVLYKRNFDGAVPLVYTMSLMPLFKTGSFVAISVLLSRNEQRLRVLMQCFAVVLSVGGGLWLIPHYGVVGATWLVVATEALLCALYSLGAVYVMRRSLQ